MAVALDATASSAQALARTTPASFNITLTGTGANRRIILGFAALNSGGGIPTVNSVTVGATDGLTAVAGAALQSGATRVELWEGALTVTGTVAVSVGFTLSGAAHIIALYALAVTGCDLVNNGLTAGPGTAPINLAMTSPSGDLSTTVMLMATNGNGGGTSTQTEYADGSVNSPTSADRKTTGTDTDPTHQLSSSGIHGTAIAAGANFRATGTLNAFTLALASGSHALTGTLALLAQQAFTSWLRVGH